jgi:hypothetical protein
MKYPPFPRLTPFRVLADCVLPTETVFRPVLNLGVLEADKSEEKVTAEN